MGVVGESIRSFEEAVGMMALVVVQEGVVMMEAAGGRWAWLWSGGGVIGSLEEVIGIMALLVVEEMISGIVEIAAGKSRVPLHGGGGQVRESGDRQAHGGGGGKWVGGFCEGWTNWAHPIGDGRGGDCA